MTEFDTRFDGMLSVPVIDESCEPFGPVDFRPLEIRVAAVGPRSVEPVVIEDKSLMNAGLVDGFIVRFSI